MISGRRGSQDGLAPGLSPMCLLVAGKTGQEETRWNRRPVGWMLAVLGCLGHAGDWGEQGCTSGGALQDGQGQGRVGRAWQVVTASRMNRPTTGVELSVRHGPFPLCAPRHHTAQHPQAQQLPTVSGRPDALDRLPVFPRASPPFALP